MGPDLGFVAPAILGKRGTNFLQRTDARQGTPNRFGFLAGTEYKDPFAHILWYSCPGDFHTVCIAIEVDHKQQVSVRKASQIAKLVAIEGVEHLQPASGRCQYLDAAGINRGM